MAFIGVLYDGASQGFWEAAYEADPVPYYVPPADVSPPPTLSSVGAIAHAIEASAGVSVATKPIVAVVSKTPVKAVVKPPVEATARTLAARESTRGIVPITAIRTFAARKERLAQLDLSVRTSSDATHDTGFGAKVGHAGVRAATAFWRGPDETSMSRVLSRGTSGSMAAWWTTPPQADYGGSRYETFRRLAKYWQSGEEFEKLAGIRRLDLGNMDARQPTKRHPKSGRRLQGHTPDARRGRGSPTRSGRSKPHVVETIPLGPFGDVVVTQQASATVSVGKGNLQVSFNPSNGDVSIGDHGFSFTDPGVLGVLARGWRHDQAEAGGLIFSGKKEFATSVINAPSFDVSIGGTKQKAQIDKVVFAAGVTVKNGVPEVDLETSASFSIVAPDGRKTTVTYTITTAFRYEGRPGVPTLTPAEVTEVVFAAALGAAFVVIQSRLISLEK